MINNKKIAVIIPSYKVSKHILSVLSDIPDIVDHIYVVDDACPENSGKLVDKKCKDKRVKVIYNEINQGVGGATINGMQAALSDEVDCMVKIDGDGQHDPLLLEKFVRPIIEGCADFTKGNRFFYLEDLKQMPTVRLIGNALLSFAGKLSSGYWNIFDPTNGYLAIHPAVFKALPHNKINKRYFFESDLLFRLYTVRANIIEIPMHALYGEEESNLQPAKMILPFLFNHIKNMLKRVFYSYFLRNFSLVSIYLIFGAVFLTLGAVMGITTWLNYLGMENGAPFGMVVFPGIMILIGLEMLIGFLSNDVSSVPNSPIHPLLSLTSYSSNKKDKK